MHSVRNLVEKAVTGTSVDTLVIHLDDRSTDFLKPIYAGLGYPVISGAVTEQAMLQAIEQAGRVFMLGHGGPGGLFGRQFTIGAKFGPALAAKPDGVYIWCNADAYAKQQKLSGLVSGMFISEVHEAAMFGIRATQAEVDASNDLFAKVVREHLDAGDPHSKVKECYTHATCQIVKFNNDRMYTFDKGVPTPALHATSLGHHDYVSAYKPLSGRDLPKSSGATPWSDRGLDSSRGSGATLEEWREELTLELAYIGYVAAPSPSAERVLERITETLFQRNFTVERAADILLSSLPQYFVYASENQGFELEDAENVPRGTNAP